MRARGAVGAAIGPSIRYGLETLRRDIPIGIRAEAAGLADEHRAGLFVALELPERPARRDVRELAAARVKERRAVARVVARAVKRGRLVEPVVRGLRGRHHEVALVAVDEQYGSVQLRERVEARDRKRWGR